MQVVQRAPPNAGVPGNRCQGVDAGLHVCVLYFSVDNSQNQNEETRSKILIVIMSKLVCFFPSWALARSRCMHGPSKGRTRWGGAFRFFEMKGKLKRPSNSQSVHQFETLHRSISVHLMNEQGASIRLALEAEIRLPHSISIIKKTRRSATASDSASSSMMQDPHASFQPVVVPGARVPGTPRRASRGRHMQPLHAGCITAGACGRCSLL